MNEKILLEIFGYTGSALVIISMMMTSVNMLRILNICGAVISAIYSVIYLAYPIVFLNVSLILINVFQLIRSKIKGIGEKNINTNRDKSQIPRI